jgi:hypothetical protein
VNDETTRTLSLLILAASIAAVVAGIAGSWPLLYGLATPVAVGSAAFGLSTLFGRD